MIFRILTKAVLSCN